MRPELQTGSSILPPDTEWARVFDQDSGEVDHMLRRIQLLIPLVALFWGMMPALTTSVMADEGGDTAQATDGESGDGEAGDEGAGEDGSGGETEEAEIVAADEASSGGDVAFMAFSIAMVLMMTCPGLALFYGGLVRKKNILSVMMQCVFLMGLMSVLWVVIGYSLAFTDRPADDPLAPYFGGFDHVLLNGHSPSMTSAEGAELQKEINESSASALSDKLIVIVFQGMFFIITPALICGAFAERMKFTSMAVFCALWGLFVYCPIAHWVWSGTGWLSEFNIDNPMFPAIDFAGGLVVHISSGVSALVVAMLIGKRKGFPTEPMPPHNLTYTCIGTGLLWVGWFGFNGGSQVAADGRAVNAILVTHIAASAGVLSWSAAEYFKHGKASILGACSGAVAGLVCITPAAGAVSVGSALIMGLAAGVICFLACTKIKNAFGYDDSLDAFGVHGVGGMLGAILAGVFATPLVGGAECRGALTGNPSQLVNQLISVVAAVAFSVVGTLIIAKIVDAVMGLRVSEDEEVQGLDISQHGEEGYIFQ